MPVGFSSLQVLLRQTMGFHLSVSFLVEGLPIGSTPFATLEERLRAGLVDESLVEQSYFRQFNYYGVAAGGNPSWCHLAHVNAKTQRTKIYTGQFIIAE